jgi:hypothetical protein
MIGAFDLIAMSAYAESLQACLPLVLKRRAGWLRVSI